MKQDQTNLSLHIAKNIQDIIGRTSDDNLLTVCNILSLLNNRTHLLAEHLDMDSVKDDRRGHLSTREDLVSDNNRLNEAVKHWMNRFESLEKERDGLRAELSGLKFKIKETSILYSI